MAAPQPAKPVPKDAEVMVAILKDMGVTEYEPRLVNQMLEFTYRKLNFSNKTKTNMVVIYTFSEWQAMPSFRTHKLKLVPLVVLPGGSAWW